MNTADDVVAIGYQAGKSNDVDNQFIVKQANINAVPLIQGDFSTGNVGIGTTTPQNTLNVVGDANVTGHCVEEGTMISVVEILENSSFESSLKEIDENSLDEKPRKIWKIMKK